MTLAEFYIGKYEVTNDQYAAFVKATERAVPFTWRDNERIPDGKEDHPVTTVSWYDAVAFTRWLGEETAMPFRLCTEAEWEKACRGTTALVYPWAGAFDERKANTSVGRIETTTPAGSYSPAGDSPYGVSDMAGNVREWVTDWYAEDYYEASPVDSPQGPETGEYRVLRSGSYSDNEEYARCASRLSRYDANSGFYYVGFRLCASPGLASPGQ